MRYPGAMTTPPTTPAKDSGKPAAEPTQVLGHVRQNSGRPAEIKDPGPPAANRKTIHLGPLTVPDPPKDFKLIAAGLVLGVVMGVTVSRKYLNALSARGQGVVPCADCAERKAATAGVVSDTATPVAAAPPPNIAADLTNQNVAEAIRQHLAKQSGVVRVVATEPPPGVDPVPVQPPPHVPAEVPTPPTEQVFGADPGGPAVDIPTPPTVAVFGAPAAGPPTVVESPPLVAPIVGEDGFDDPAPVGRT
jgi:hypothetical protein